MHFHDVFWPFEYPEEWLREGRAWNESYLVRAFLQFNSRFELLFFNSYLGLHHRDKLADRLPLALRDTGASLWMWKVS